MGLGAMHQKLADPTDSSSSKMKFSKFDYFSKYKKKDIINSKAHALCVCLLLCVLCLPFGFACVFCVLWRLAGPCMSLQIAGFF